MLYNKAETEKKQGGERYRERGIEKKSKRKALGGMTPGGPLNFFSFFCAFFMVLSLPGLHSCFRAGGFFLQSPDKRAALSSPAGRSVKAIALAVHCPVHEIFFFKKAERAKERKRREFKGGCRGGEKSA